MAMLSQAELRANSMFLNPLAAFFPDGKGSTGHERAIRHTYDGDNDRWTKTDITVQLSLDVYAQGAMRSVYEMRVIGEDESFVAKLSTDERDKVDLVLVEVKMQSVCQKFARMFNERSVNKVDFLDCFAIELPGRVHPRTGATLFMSCERKMKGVYIKYQNNFGFCDPNYPWVHAFSHYSYEASNHSLLIVDLQGVGGKLTDPQIHSNTEIGCVWGKGDMGIAGIQMFFSSYNFSNYGRQLGLPSKVDYPRHMTVVGEYMQKLQKEQAQPKEEPERLVAPYSSEPTSDHVSTPAGEVSAAPPIQATPTVSKVVTAAAAAAAAASAAAARALARARLPPDTSAAPAPQAPPAAPAPSRPTGPVAYTIGVPGIPGRANLSLPHRGVSPNRLSGAPPRRTSPPRLPPSLGQRGISPQRLPLPQQSAAPQHASPQRPPAAPQRGMSPLYAQRTPPVVHRGVSPQRTGPALGSAGGVVPARLNVISPGAFQRSNSPYSFMHPRAEAPSDLHARSRPQAVQDANRAQGRSPNRPLHQFASAFSEVPVATSTPGRPVSIGVTRPTPRSNSRDQSSPLITVIPPTSLAGRPSISHAAIEMGAAAAVTVRAAESGHTTKNEVPEKPAPVVISRIVKYYVKDSEGNLVEKPGSDAPGNNSLPSPSNGIDGTRSRNDGEMFIDASGSWRGMREKEFATEHHSRRHTVSPHSSLDRYSQTSTATPDRPTRSLSTMTPKPYAGFILPNATLGRHTTNLWDTQRPVRLSGELNRQEHSTRRESTTGSESSSISAPIRLEIRPESHGLSKYPISRGGGLAPTPSIRYSYPSNTKAENDERTDNTAPPAACKFDGSGRLYSYRCFQCNNTRVLESASPLSRDHPSLGICPGCNLPGTWLCTTY